MIKFLKRLIVPGIIFLVTSPVFAVAFITFQAAPPAPQRFEALGSQRFGSDPDDIFVIECDHKNGTIVYVNQRGGILVVDPATVHLECSINEGVK